MRARDGVEEDLSAYAREDLVYKAKLAEQAERCARHRIARANGDGRRAGRRGRMSRRRRRATRERDRDATETRARARASDRARDRAHARVESSRFGSIRFDSIDRSIERTTDRMGAGSNERTIGVRRVMRVDARDVRVRRRARGWWTGKGVETRDEGRIDASPASPRGSRARGTNARRSERVRIEGV